MKNLKLIIIGAGPAGISLAAEAREAGIESKKILMIDKAETHSWVIRSLYPDKKLVAANYKGLPAVCHGVMSLQDSTKKETISYLNEAIKKTKVKVNYQEEVRKIKSIGTSFNPLFEIETNKDRYRTQIVVIAIGIFGKPNKPNYKIPYKLKPNIHFDVSSFRCQTKNILVVGGGDSAAEFSQYLVEMGNNIELSYRGLEFSRMNSFNLHVIKELEKNRKIKILNGSNIKELSLSNSANPLVSFYENKFDSVEYDKVVYALGGSTPNSFLKLIGIEFDNEKSDLNTDGETKIPGIFVAGDLLAGKKGGSIVQAFNSSRVLINKICNNYIDCKVS
jgi:thioredoxin reductase (NADPH)